MGRAPNAVTSFVYCMARAALILGASGMSGAGVTGALVADATELVSLAAAEAGASLLLLLLHAMDEAKTQTTIRAAALPSPFKRPFILPASRAVPCAAEDGMPMRSRC